MKPTGLKELLEGFEILSGRIPDKEITSISFDSRSVKEGALFFAVPGVNKDGAQFAASAVKCGALAVVSARSLSLGVPSIVVEDVRDALSIAASRFYGNPSEKLVCVGVTGTNGKTTVCHLVSSICSYAGKCPWGILGTVGHFMGGGAVPALTTTPDPVSLQSYLAEMVENGFQGCAMELSSHALVQKRGAGISFDVAVFTNLTRDHLDYHGSIEAYGEAKATLFSALAPGGSAILNSDDPAWKIMAGAIKPGTRVVTFGMGGGEKPDVTASNLECNAMGSTFTLVVGSKEGRVELPLLGEFNVENALASAATAHALSIPLEGIIKGLVKARPVPGRLEPVPGPDGVPGVIVDYAHTPDALERVIRTLRPLCNKGRLMVLFGCGGDRDRGKRSLMGRVAVDLADSIWVTSDNPRTEEAGSIIEDILEGVKGGNDRIRVIQDRKSAIENAVASADGDDLLLIAGKGHETYQIVGTEKIPFDDREVARRALWRE